MALPDFDAMYRGSSAHSGIEQVPWNIGEPQPAIAGLIDSGLLHGRVLDAGCGVGETAMDLACRGFRVVGLDSSPVAIGQARSEAERRGLDVTFTVADITAFTGYDGVFDTVVDCTLFHSLPIDSRGDYLAAVARAAAPGAVLHVLAFSDSASFPPDNAPNAVDESTLRAEVGQQWIVDAVHPSTIAGIAPVETPRTRTDGRGRTLLPAHLLRAHLPD